MRLWITRHAIAEDQSATGHDEDRRLTAHGEKLFKRFVEGLAEEQRMPQRILSSPLIRAHQTAEILAKASGLKKKQVEMTEQLAPGFLLSNLLQVVNESLNEGAEISDIAVVGHQPEMGAITSQLIGGGHVLFEKGNIACIEFDGAAISGRGHLVWFRGPE